MSRHDLLISVSVSSVLVAIFVAVFIYFRSPVYSYTIHLPVSPRAPQIALAYGEVPALSDPVFFQRVREQFLSEQASFITADLSAMTLTAYRAGEQVLQVPIRSIGREGSWWETPAGLYQVKSKERNHFSSIGHVYMPWSLNFQGNFFIHGWPYGENNLPVSSNYSGGCIRLDTADAEKLYKLVELGMPILVFNQDFSSDNFNYEQKPQNISSLSYLSADLKNNHVFLEENAKQVLPIASLTKLMTALVAVEHINLDNIATVPAEALVATSKPRLKAGQEISIYQLLFPLLLESSNESAEVIARYFGRENFINKMNEKATSLGLKQTKFVDVSGASAGNISTAEDLFMLAKYIYHNRSFIFKLTSGQVKNSAYGEHTFADLQNFNSFAGDPRFAGGKTGQTSAAGETELAVFELSLGENGATRPVVFITLGSRQSHGDISNLASNIASNFGQNF